MSSITMHCNILMMYLYTDQHFSMVEGTRKEYPNETLTMPVHLT